MRFYGMDYGKWMKKAYRMLRGKKIVKMVNEDLKLVLREFIEESWEISKEFWWDYGINGLVLREHS